MWYNVGAYESSYHLNMKQYSLFIGLQKVLVSAAIFAVTLTGYIIYASQPELGDQAVVDVLSKYLEVIFGTMTINGLLAMIVNFLKVKFLK